MARVFDAAVSRGTMTRRELIDDTGLSKATISRLVDDLERLGLLAPEGSADAAIPANDDVAGQQASRGRRPTSLVVPRSAGQVVGISLGLQRTGVLAMDLAGREVSWGTAATPVHDDVASAVAWMRSLVTRAQRSPPAPLRRILVAVPARVVDGNEVPNPPAALLAIGGRRFTRELSAALGSEVVLDTDANMALAGLTVEGFIPDGSLPVLLNMSTVLTMAMLRRDGSAAHGVSSSFGNFSVLPFPIVDGVSSLGALLSTHGLEALCAQRGVKLSRISDLWGGDDELGRYTSAPESPELAAIVQLFTEALSAALRMIAVISDPLLIVLAGRLAPLAEAVLPRLEESLARDLAEPPRILIANSRTRVHTTSLGAAHSALTDVRRSLSERLASGDFAVD